MRILRYKTELVSLMAGVIGIGNVNLHAAESVSSASSFRNPDHSGASIQFESSNYDFGEVKEGAVIRHDFIFTNNGTALLEVTNVTSLSHNIRIEDWTKSVLPGQTGKISVELATSGLVKTASIAIIVASNNNSKRLIGLAVTGKIWNAIEVNPPRLKLSLVGENTSNALGMTYIINNADQPLDLSDPETDDPTVKAKLTPLEDKKGYQLELRAVHRPQRKSSLGRITIKTSWTNQPELIVPYTLALLPIFTVNPARIMLPLQVNNGSDEILVSIKNNSSKPISLNNPSINADGAKVSIVPVSSGQEYVLRLQLPPNFEVSPRKRIVLSVKTSDPSQSLIQVPVICPPHFHRPEKKK